MYILVVYLHGEKGPTKIFRRFCFSTSSKVRALVLGDSIGIFAKSSRYSVSSDSVSEFLLGDPKHVLMILHCDSVIVHSGEGLRKAGMAGRLSTSTYKMCCHEGISI